MKRIMHKIYVLFCALALIAACSACGGQEPSSTNSQLNTLPVIGPDITLASKEPSSEQNQTEAETPKQTEAETSKQTEQESSSQAPVTEPVQTTEAPTEPASTQEPETPKAPETTQEQTQELVPNVTNFVTEGTNGYVIVIDPGHQEKGNSEKEPVGPGASETKAKVSSGTASRFNGYPEYKVNMEVALKLRTELLKRGYTVIMTRTGHAVNISNIERATIANNVNADAFIRIHCNGSENASVHGIGIYYQTPQNPYNAALHDEAKALNGCMLRHMLALTGARDDGLVESDAYSGINWCKVPAGLVEMGYMTNQEEDAKLQDGAYQNLLAQGMADGIDEFLSTRAPREHN